jgi:RNA methyltransferase, TrmH family
VRNIEKIEKLKNPFIQEARELSQSKFRNKTNRFLLYGAIQLDWAINFNVNIDHIFISEKLDATDYDQYNTTIFRVSEGLLKKISGTNYVIPCIGVASYSKKTILTDFTIVFDGVQDYGNIGTIIRTANAYGINEFVTTNKEFDPFYQKTIDSSRGSVFNSSFLKLSSPTETIDLLKKRGYQVIATSPYGDSIQSIFELAKKPIALVLGNETNGISKDIKENADKLIQIPMSSSVESLNVGVAAGISIYELKMKEAITMLTEKINNSIGREMGETLEIIKNLYDKKLKSISEYNANQVILLMVLNSNEKLHKTELKELIGYDEDSITETLNILILNELVTDNGEKIYITQKGKEILAKLWFIHEQVEDIALKGFSIKEKNNFTDYLIRVRQNLTHTS